MLDFLDLAISNSYVCGLVIVAFGGKISYVLGLVIYTFGG